MSTKEKPPKEIGNKAIILFIFGFISLVALFLFFCSIYIKKGSKSWWFYGQGFNGFDGGGIGGGFGGGGGGFAGGFGGGFGGGGCSGGW